MIVTYTKGNRAVEIEFDAMMRASDVTTSTVTSHPVERGAPANDHIRANPNSLTVDAVVSNTPLRLPKTHAGGARLNAGGMSVSYETVKYDGQRNQIRGDASASASTLQFDRPFDRVGDVYEELQYIQDHGLLVDVTTTDREGGFRDYQEMAITGLTIPVDVDSGSAKTFSFNFQKLRIVDTKKVDAPEAKKHTKSKGEQGKKEVKEDAEEHLKSLAAQVFDKATGAYGGK